jgi:hypothetical protein
MRACWGRCCREAWSGSAAGPCLPESGPTPCPPSTLEPRGLRRVQCVSCPRSPAWGAFLSMVREPCAVSVAGRMAEHSSCCSAGRRGGGHILAMVQCWAGSPRRSADPVSTKPDDVGLVSSGHCRGNRRRMGRIQLATGLGSSGGSLSGLGFGGRRRHHAFGPEPSEPGVQSIGCAEPGQRDDGTICVFRAGGPVDGVRLAGLVESFLSTDQLNADRNGSMNAFCWSIESSAFKNRSPSVLNH